MTAPIDLYYWPTSNGKKISIAMYEMSLPFNLHPIDIEKGDQFAPEFLAIAPNNRMPAIVDPEGPDGAPISIFESGAILQYLARKTGQFYGKSERDRISVDQWLMWQMGGIGPNAGQVNHFVHSAPQMGPDKVQPYAQERFMNEVGRLHRVLDTQLSKNRFVAGDFYSIADMALYPWISRWERHGQTLDNKPNMARWLNTISARPAVVQGMALGADLRNDGPRSAEAMRILYTQKG